MKETRYCDHCHRETEHTVELERDASHPPSSFIEAQQEGWASVEECIFYANGDSEWRVTCTVCRSGYIEL